MRINYPIPFAVRGLISLFSPFAMGLILVVLASFRGLAIGQPTLKWAVFLVCQKGGRRIFVPLGVVPGPTSIPQGGRGLLGWVVDCHGHGGMHVLPVGRDPSIGMVQRGLGAQRVVWFVLDVADRLAFFAEKPPGTCGRAVIVGSNVIERPVAVDANPRTMP